MEEISICAKIYDGLLESDAGQSDETSLIYFYGRDIGILHMV